jgi:hypothetical protein
LGGCKLQAAWFNDSGGLKSSKIMSSDTHQNEYRRLGQTEKCPACGFAVDDDAYRCPKCLIYFCFKCRRRVQKQDQQFQCMNQQCRYYGKLLCNACVVDVPNTTTTTSVPPNETLTFIVFAAGLVVASCWFWISFPLALGIGVLIFGIVWTIALKTDLLKQNAPVTETVVSHTHKGCIACQQPVEHLHR